MAPASRPSASTPAKPRVNVNTGALSPGFPTAGTRRTPHCTKCHRPRAGHPRSGCPYVDASVSSPTSPSARKPTSRAAQPTSATDDSLSQELSSLHIVNQTDRESAPDTIAVPPTGHKVKRKLSVRFALVPEQTLASLSPTDTQLVEQLLQPGVMSNAVTPEDRVAHVLRWRKTLHDDDPKEDPARGVQPEGVKAESPPNGVVLPPPSRSMPCTLSTPTASLTTTEPVSDRHIGTSAIDMNETVYLLPEQHPETARSRPLGRSMSFEQRSLFLQQLNHSSSMAPATLLSLPLADLDSVQHDAEKIGFHVRVLPGREDTHKWVVLGTEEDAVHLLAKKFLEEEYRSTRAKGSGSKLTAVAGGVLFGAVATWTGLAFS